MREESWHPERVTETDPGRQARLKERMGGDGAVLDVELERARAAGSASRKVVLVEGASDQRAIDTLARRWGRDLKAEGVEIIPIAGATNLVRFLEVLGPHGHDVELAGLCDVGEETSFRLALEDARLGSNLTRSAMERLGFYVCVRDLEEELIRALGTEAAVAIIARDGRLRSFRSFQNQPAQRDKTLERQIWTWLGNHKIRYASLLADALEPEQVPRPLQGVLAAV